MKSFLAICLIAVLATSALASNKDNLNSFMKGFFADNQLPMPDTHCLDDATADKIAPFVSKLLDQLENSKLSDITTVISSIKSFVDSLSPEFKTCVLSDKKTLGDIAAKFGFSAETDVKAVVKKVASYLLMHFAAVKNSVSDIHSEWNGNNFEVAGAKSSKLAHSIIGDRKNRNRLVRKVLKAIFASRDNLQQAFAGFYSANGLAEPTTLAKCFDDASASAIDAFIPQLLDKLAQASLSNIQEIVKMCEDFGKKVDPAVGTCLLASPELAPLGAKYGIDAKTDAKALGKKIATYIALHMNKVHEMMSELSGKWKSGSYKEFGTIAAKDAHVLVGK